MANLLDYYCIISEGKFMDATARTMIPAEMFNKMFDKTQVKQVIDDRGCINLTWSPGNPMIIKDTCIVDGAWVDAPGKMVFNRYVPPKVNPKGDATKADRWFEFGRKLFLPEDHEHMLNCFAHKLQHPETKINHAIVIGSEGQGIGKDMFLQPVRAAAGIQNWANRTAGQAFMFATNFNTFLARLFIRISEAHDMKEKRFQFYDMMKDWCAGPPETLGVADKHVKMHEVDNVVLPIFTTNHRTDGLYWPQEDRRMFYAWSECKPSDFTQEFYDELGAWYKKGGGSAHVSAFLLARDVSKFNPYARPPKTAAWEAVAAISADSQDGELLDVLDSMSDEELNFPPDRPNVVTLASLYAAALRLDQKSELCDMLSPKNRAKKAREIGHRLSSANYIALANPNVEKGWWKIGGVRQMVYVSSKLSQADALAAVRDYVKTTDEAIRGAKAARFAWRATADFEAEPRPDFGA